MGKNFIIIATEYWTNILSLKTYTESLRPMAFDKDKSTFNDLVKNIGVFFNLSNESINEAINQMYETVRDTSASSAIKINHPHIPIPLNPQIEVDMEKIGKFLNKHAFNLKRSNVDILHRGILINLIGFYEFLIANILRQYYIERPKALSGDEKVISFNELMSFSNIQEAVDFIINEKLENFLRGSLDDWAKFFLKQLKIDMRELVDDWDSFFEIFQRRHIFVHNDGRVSKQYLSKVSGAWIKKHTKNIEAGDYLDVSDEYLSYAIRTCLTSGLILIDKCWEKLLPDDKESRDFALNKFVYQLLLSNEWQTAMTLCQHALNRECRSHGSMLVFTLNKWLCLKNLGKWNEIKASVEKFDVSACSPKFGICIYALLENKESFINTLPLAKHSGVTKEDLYEWPIIEIFREQEDFDEIIEKHFDS